MIALDEQTLHGKAPAGVARAAAAAGGPGKSDTAAGGPGKSDTAAGGPGKSDTAARSDLPVVAVCGVSSLSPEQLSSAGITRAYALADIEPDLMRCREQAGPLLEDLAERAARDCSFPESTVAAGKPLAAEASRRAPWPGWLLGWETDGCT